MTTGMGRTRRGGAIAWVVIVLMMLLAFLGLAVDVGYAYYTGQKLQVAADAAALAGAHRIWEGHAGARDAAIEIAAANKAGGAEVQLGDNPDNDAAGDVVLGTYDADTRTFTPSTEVKTTNAVMVRARRTEGSVGGPLPLFFGPLFDNASLELTRWAIAVAEGGPAYADIISLDPDDKAAFYVHGTPVVDVGDDGSIQVNSSHAQGSIYQGTSVVLNAGEVHMVAEEFETRGHPSIPPSSDMNTGEPFLSDPLYPMPIPAYAMETADPRMEITGTGTFQPGYYPNGLRMNADDNIVLEPGVYILGDGPTEGGDTRALEVIGGQLTGYGVTFVLASGSIHDRGGGTVNITPPTDGTYEGIQVFQIYGNTDAALFNGGSTWGGTTTDDPSTPDLDESTAGAGTFYFPDAHFAVGGNAKNGSASLMINGLIAKTIEVFGTARLNITSGWDGDQGTTAVYIVE
ncbi:MAG: pilus assembly protein TadG-related protein [Planctomycetota bacterium]|nr:pilus assembly protein TadG-related protein [Planctomycetota bacterium]